MSSEVLVSQPHVDSTRVDQEPSGMQLLTQPEVPQPSSGYATAGYRSAKYSPAEWFSNYQSILRRAGTDQHEAQRIQRGSRHLGQLTDATTRATQADGSRLLGDRLQEIHRWRSELQRHIEQLQADTESLKAAKRRLEKALDATETPYAIATDNLTCRTRRPGPDLVRDTVEEELLKEVELVRSIQAILKRTIAQTVSQIKRNLDTQQTLEADWSDKFQSYDVDVHCGRFSNMSVNTQQYLSSAALQDQVCNSTSWTKFTQDNLSKAVSEGHASESLRHLVEHLLHDTTEDLMVHSSNVDRAFSQRCTELTDAKIQLEMKLAQVLQQIGAQEKNVVFLQQTIHNKEAPLRVAQSRLHLRSLRPNMELCRDEAQLSLEGEVRQIEDTLTSLQQQLDEATGSLSHLQETRRTLERDIVSKTHSLFIDRDKCMSHRKRYPSVSTLSGY